MRTKIRKLTHVTALLLLFFSMGPRHPALGHPLTQTGDLPDASTLDTPPTIEPALRQALASPSDLPIRIIATLKTPDMPHTPDAPTTPTALVSALQANLDSALAPLDALLADAQRQGQVLERRDLWIVRSVALTAHPDFVRRLAISPDVAELRLDHYRQYLDIPPVGETAVGEGNAIWKSRLHYIAEETATGVITTTWGLTRIRAPETWATLAISGTGATVAVMDTGVDMLHPALSANYRGNLGKGFFDHDAAWFDAVNGGTYPYDDHGHGTHVAGTAVGQAVGTTAVNGGTYPYDDHGHGTHVAGTAVGQASATNGNIGVAPAAQWVGVKALSGSGYGYDSWIHAGFQWLLAPGGDPARAPDVVNNSWSSNDSSRQVFAEDIARLHQAGIVAVFATGNVGPSAGSTGSPASNPGIFAVGASDPDDDVAYFSGRGPSPWDEVKPYVVAPGVAVLSSLPGGIYGSKQGTSMATPHVAGLVALLRSADPTLTVAETMHVITQTAVPLSTTLPNNASGWGCIDAFAAIAAVTHPAIVTGTVQDDAGQPLAGAAIVAVPHTPSGNHAQTATNAEGVYQLALTASMYDFTASAFGHVAQTRWNVEALTDTQQQVDFQLQTLPTGTLSGRLTISGTSEPPTNTTIVVSALGTPVTTTATITGAYALELPAGGDPPASVYTVTARGMGYRVASAAVDVTAGLTTRYDFVLEPAPKLLLVDDGAWTYQSQIHYWEAALDDLGYVYDTYPIKNPPGGTPVSTTLEAYDVVLWSSPQSAPGLVDAGKTLIRYLKRGGRFLLSGQDVAYYDGGGEIFYPGPQDYLRNNMSTVFAADNVPSRQVQGLGPFAGLTVTIEGGTGANNQIGPDAVTISNSVSSAPLWHYTSGELGGVQTSICEPHRSLFFAFGFEAIAEAGQRSEVMARSIEWLTTAPITAGIAMKRDSPSPGIGLPGTLVTHTVQLRHIGYRSPRDPVTLTVSSATWPVTVKPYTISLPACWAVVATVPVTIPESAGVNMHNTVTLTVESTLAGTSTAITLATKTPAPVLLVDDDRWYPLEEYYTTALDATGIPFDLWDNEDNLAGILGERSPTLDVVQKYPIVVWFTGYDWFAPVYPVEATVLEAYLAGGGRLLLSSQDFLREHNGSALAAQFGVLNWEEVHNPTSAYGVPDHTAGGTWGPVTLDFPFRNFGDAIEPAPGAQPVMRGDMDQPLAVAMADAETSGARTLFYAFPLETLPFDVRTRSLSQAVDWLSPLGSSQWMITPTAPLPGARVTHTLVLHNNTAVALQTSISHTLPASQTLIAETLSPTLHYDAPSRTVAWSGKAATQSPSTFTWAVNVAEQPGHIPLTLTLGLPTWGLTFNRATTLHVGGADLSASGWLSPEGAAIRPTDIVTLAFALRNTGTLSATGEVRVWGTENSTPTTVLLPPPWGWNQTFWVGELAPEETRILDVPVRAWTWNKPLRVDAILEDTAGQRWERRRWLTVTPWAVYLPTVMKQ